MASSESDTSIGGMADYISDIDHNQDQPQSENITPEMQFFLRGQGWDGKSEKVIGEGREKSAMEVGDDKVLLRYHSKHEFDKTELPPEYFKAQFYLHKILHLILPDNFADVHMGGGNGIVFSKVPDNPDFIRAKEIQQRLLATWEFSVEDREFYRQKREEFKQNLEFQLVYGVLEELGIATGGRDVALDELALPVNAVMVDSIQ